MRISDWSSDVCSSDLSGGSRTAGACALVRGPGLVQPGTARPDHRDHEIADRSPAAGFEGHAPDAGSRPCRHAGLRRFTIVQQREQLARPRPLDADVRSEEHTSELQSLMRISYAVFCLQKKKKTNNHD